MEVEEEAVPEVIEAPIEPTEQAVAVGVVVPTQGTLADALNTGRSPPSPTRRPLRQFRLSRRRRRRRHRHRPCGGGDDRHSGCADAQGDGRGGFLHQGARSRARGGDRRRSRPPPSATAPQAAAVEAAGQTRSRAGVPRRRSGGTRPAEGVAAAAVAAVAAPVASELNGDDAVGEWVPIRVAAAVPGEATTRNDGGDTTETVARGVWYGSGI